MSFVRRGGSDGRGRGGFEGRGRGGFEGRGRGGFEGRGRGGFEGRGRGGFEGRGRGGFEGRGRGGMGRGFEGKRPRFGESEGHGGHEGRSAFPRGERKDFRGGSYGGRGGQSFHSNRGQDRGNWFPTHGVPRPLVPGRESPSGNQSKIVVILEKAGLLVGRDGIVDAFDRAGTTEIANPSLQDVRPDIVHQCLLALFDSDLAHSGRLRVYISLFDRSGKTIEMSPNLRPPRTLARFKGLMAAVLTNGFIMSSDGETLLKVLPGSIAPIIPHTADVIGLCNDLQAPVRTPTAVAKAAVAKPVSNELQGGEKNAYGFYCISCTDDNDMSGIDYVTDQICLSEFPASPHVLCARLCEGFSEVLEDKQ